MASGDTKTNQYLDVAANGTRADLPTDTCCETRTQTLVREVAERIIGVEEEVERLENNPDVVDIVATYQDLQDYDTSGLTDKDIIRVLEDSTHDNNSTYYRWNAATSQFDFVGEISGGSSVNVVQAPGTSTTDVMSQNATTSMVFADPSTQGIVKIGKSAVAGTSRNVAIGYYATANNTFSVAVGGQSYAPNDRATALGSQCNAQSNYSLALGNGATVYSGAPYSVAIGYNSKANQNFEHSVALGDYASTTRTGEINIGAGTSGHGYNSTNYRVIGGVHDPVDAHDAATKGYVDNRLGGLTLVSITQTDYDALATKDPNTLYVITGA